MDDSRNTTGRTAPAPIGAAPQAEEAAAPDRGDGVFALAPEHRAQGGAEPQAPAAGAAAPDTDGVFALTPAHRADADAPQPPGMAESATADAPGAASERGRSVADDGAGAQVAQAVQRELERVLGAEAAPDLRGFVAAEVSRALRDR